jgi:CheY-like chemotaxis protein
MSENDAAKAKVVLVDDEKDFLKLMENWLKPLYEVASFSEPEEVSARVAALAPDVAVLDVHMPAESGFALCKRLRAQPGFESLPVVFLTGSKTDEDFVQHLETGGSRYLTKPISRQALLDAIAEQLGTAPRA